MITESELCLQIKSGTEVEVQDCFFNDTTVHHESLFIISYSFRCELCFVVRC